MSSMAEELRDILPDGRPAADYIKAASLPIARILETALEKKRISESDTLALLQVEGKELRALLTTADDIRREDVGDDVTYVINRNINFTNVCFVGCQFCAFKRQRWESDAYYHDDETVIGKIQEGINLGATEICMQGGINAQMKPDTYKNLLIKIKKEFPALHVHAFSPMEILYGSRRANQSFEEFLTELRDEGLGSIPGTAAEILDDEVRDILSYKKVDTSQWIDIITTAHRLGIPTTSTIMYGHVEKDHHIAAHLGLLRKLQDETGGFTEFVPLRFIHNNTLLFQRGLVTPQKHGTTDLRIYAISRLFFRGSIDNILTSWVKLGHDLAAASLAAGVNDFGGTLMEESISREAGATAGEYTPVEEIERIVRGMGRRPRQRTTLYGKIEESLVA
ncbi:MAG: 5-amino-6-(D-ribitylamino)uracil--L-tyrosine 4-hydroxyphenyl transferase CofH [Deltaproteobacteria bacterium]